mmetsp:Transcript_40570/g.85150  ORF Transcript_40570/g.85150 Transcript_40570/m.85150 type:complete len:496 (-) Transcript_40570:68-1555(-)
MESRPPKAVIAGGGPAGALTAKVLADRGFDVDLYEAYPHPSLGKEEKKKAYSISISERGQLALQRCGVDPLTDLDAVVISEAVSRHNSTTGKTNVTKLNNADIGSVFIKRRDLAASLLRAAEKSGVNVNCGWKLNDINFVKKEVTLVEGPGEDAGANEKTVSYDLLVGADGVISQTRNLLSNYLNEKGEDFSVKATHDKMEYQVAILPKPWKELLSEEKANTPPLDTCPPASVHSWADTEMGSTALAFPTRDSNQTPISKSIVCVIFPEGMLGFMKEFGHSGYTAALSTLLADWTVDSRLDLARLLAEKDNIPSIGGFCVWSQSLSHPGSGVVLIGDAGHAMFPSLGQGCNAALESVSVFADAVEAVTGSVSSGAGCRNIDFSTSSHEDLVEAIALEYDGLRRDDALAAVDLSHSGIGGTNVRGQLHSSFIFKAQFMMMMILHKLSAGLVPKPAMLRIMKGDSARYTTLKWQIQVEKYVLCVTVGILGYGISKFI